MQTSTLKHYFRQASRSIKGSRLMFAIPTIAVALAGSANAATDTWTGSSTTDWNLAANWGGTLPATGDSLIFTNTNTQGNATLTNTFATTTNFGTITFNAGTTTTYTMNGNTFNLTGGIANNGGALETFSETGGLNLSSAAETFTVNSGGGNTAITTGITNTSGANQTLTVNGAGGLLTLGSYALSNSSTAHSDAVIGTGNVLVNGVISNGGTSAGSLQYNGTGALTLTAANTFTGTTILGNGTANGGTTPNGGPGAGTIKLDFSASGAPTSNILAANSTLDLGGGTLTIQGSNSAGVVQQAGTTTFEVGLTTINLAPGTGGNTIALNLGQMKAGQGNANFAGVANFTGISATDTVTVLNVNNSAGIVSGISGAGLTVNSSSWGTSTSQSLTNQTFTTGTNLVTGTQTTGSQIAITANAPAGLSTGTTYYVVNGNGSTYQVAATPGGTPLTWTATSSTATIVTQGNLTALPTASYTQNTGTSLGSNNNTDVVTSTTVTGSNGLSANTLRFNTNAAETITLASGTLDLNSSTNNGGGILVTNAVGSNNSTITGGFLKIPTNRGAAFYNYDTTGAATGNGLVINSVIEDINNGAGVSIVGGGLTTLGGTNIYSSTTNVSGGTLSISSNSNLGGVYISAGGNNTIAETLSALNLDGAVLKSTTTMSLDGTTASGAANSLLRAVGIGAGGATFSTGANNLTINGTMTGAGTLTKGLATGTETGTLSLGGANTLTGNTIINSGILAVTSGAAPASQTVTSLGLSTGVTTFVSGATSITVSNTTGLAIGELIQGNGIQTGTTITSVSGGLIGLSLATNGGSSSNYYIYKNAPTTVTTFAAGATSITVGSATNALVGEAVIGTGIQVGTIITGISGNVLTLSQPTTGASSATTSYVFGAANQDILTSSTNIAGGQSITATGGSGFVTGINTTGNVVTLSATNTAINTPTATFGGAWQSLGTGAVSIANVAGTSLNMSTATGTTTIASLTGGGALGGNVVLGTSASVLSTGGDNTNTAFGGVMSGAGALTKTGTGTFTLSGANTYTGSTTVNGGTLSAGVASVANTSGAFGNNSAITLANTAGVTLDISGTGDNTQIGSLTGGGSTGGNVTLGANTLTVGGDNTSPGAFAGVISSTGSPTTSLIKIGTGTFSLSGSNTYTGGTIIKSGTINASGATALGAAGDTVTVGDTTVNANAALILNGFVTYAQNITVGGNAAGGTRTITANGANLAGQVVGTTGTWTVNGPLAIVDTNASPLRFQGGLTSTAGTSGDNLTLNAQGTGAIDFRNLINNIGTITNLSTGSGGVNFNYNFGNAGSLGANVTSYIQNSSTGATTFGNQLGNPNFVGTVAVQSGTVALTVGNAFTSANVVSVGAGGTLDLQNVSQTIAGLNSISGAGGTVTDSTATALNTLTLGGSGAYSYAGNITATTPADMALTIALTGSGSQALSGTDTYTGGTLLSTGTLDINSAGALGGGTFTISSGTTIDNTSGAAVTGQTNNPAIAINGGFTFGGTKALNLGTGAVTGSTAQTLTLNGTSSNLTLGGTWTNSSDTANTLTVNGVGNTLGLGVLALDGSGTTARTQTIAGSGNVTVGQITNGASTGAQSLTYAGTGSLTVNGTTATTLATGSTLTVNSGTVVADETNITGNANVFASSTTVTLAGGTLTIKGPAAGTGSQTFATLALAAATGNTIVLSDSTGAANLTSTAALTRGTGSTLFLDLSNAGTGVFLTNLTASQVQSWSIVKDATGTGIGTTNSAKDLVRLASTVLTATNPSNLATNFTTSGTVVDTQSPISLNTLFIDTTSTAGGWDLGTHTATFGNGTIAINGNNNYSITDGSINNSPLFINNAGTGTLSLGATITGSSSLATTGNVIASGANTFTGGTTVNGGTLKAGVATVQGTSGAVGNGNQAVTVSGGTFDLNGFNVGVGALNTSAGSTVLNNGASAGTNNLTVGNNNTTMTVSGVIADHSGSNTGAIALVKNGTGTLNLSGTVANTYSGGTTLNGGTTVVTNNTAGTTLLGTGPITFNGAQLTLFSAGLANRTFAQNFVINNVAGNVYNDGSNQGGATFNGSFTGSGSLAITNGFNNQSLNFAGNMTGFTGTLDTSTDGQGTSNHTLTLSNSTNVGMAGAKLILAGGGYNGTTTGTGVVNFQWGGTGSQTIGIGELTSSGGVGGATDNQTLGVLRNSTVGTTATWSIGALNTSDTYAGTIVNGSGTSALTKVGTGTLTLTNSGDSYSGATTVSAGTLALTGSTLGGTMSVSVAATSFLTEDSASSITSVSTMNVSGTASLAGANSNVTSTTINSGGLLTLGNGTSNGSLGGSILDNGTFAVNGGTSPETIGNVISGSGVVTLASAAGVNVNNFGSGANTYGGGTTVTSGTWTIASPGDFGTGDVTITPTANTVVNTSGSPNTFATTANVTVNNGTGGVTGALVINDPSQTIASLSGNGSVVLANSGNGTVLTVNDTANSTFSGVISDNSAGGNTGGALVKQGTATLTLSGANTYTNADGGSGSPAPYATEVQAGVLKITNGAALGSGGTAAVDSGATLQMAGGIAEAGNNLTLVGTGASATTGALENVSGNNSYSGGITLAGAATIASDAGRLDITSTGGPLTGSGKNLTLAGAGNGSIEAAITTGSGSLTKTGTGTWTLAGPNTYTGGTGINRGVLALGSTGALGTTGAISFGGGTLQYSASNTTDYSARYSTAPSQAISIDTNGQNILQASALTSSGGSLTKLGAGSLSLTNATGSTYTGPTTVSAGILYANNTSGSATGSGTVTAGNVATGAANSGTLAGKGSITSSGLAINGGGTLASGDPSQISGTGLVPVAGQQVGGLALNNTPTTVGSSLGTATLVFDLGSGTSGINGGTASGQNDFSNPNNNTTYLKLAGSTTINFAGSTAISLVDLTNTTGSNGSLTLRSSSPYLLIHAGSNVDYLNLVIATGTGVNTTYSLSQGGASGYVVGVFTGGGTFNSSDLNNAGYVTPISIAQYGSDGVTPLASGTGGAYPVGALYLTGGNLEVVPEPGTWALMIGGFALLIVIQRRKSRA